MAPYLVRSPVAVPLFTILVAACASGQATGGAPAALAASHAQEGAAVAVPAGAAAPAAADAASEPLRLRPGDVVRIELRTESQLGGHFTVGDDGSILIPAIGMIPVAGRPFDEVREDVRQAYARELADDVIRVTPLVRIAVLGEVMRPGLFPVDPTHTIADVLASVGGFSPLADRSEVTVVRAGESWTIPIDPDSPALLHGLRSGDRIIVGRKSWFMENLAIFVGAAASVAAAALTSLIVR